MTGTNNGSFVYTALLLNPSLSTFNDHTQAWTFERSEGYQIDCVKRHDGEYRWYVSFVVDGIDVLLDIHPANVIAVGVGPREQEVDEYSSRTESRAG